MRSLYVVTHPEATHHRAGLVGGWYDSELTDLGYDQARGIADCLAMAMPGGARARVYSSDLRRAMGTATVIAGRLSVDIVPHFGLRETSYGDAEGRPESWLKERFVFSPRIGDRMNHNGSIRGAESKYAFASRIYGAMDVITAEDFDHQVIVTHGFALTFVVAHWIRMPLESASFIHMQSTSGGITRLVEDDVFHNRTIVSVNSTDHLQR
jgi:2,3-bisphosphoglycerate-dependent phosphoglycerate mutase